MLNVNFTIIMLYGCVFSRVTNQNRAEIIAISLQIEDYKNYCKP